MIEEVKLKLYSDPELTQFEAEFLAGGTTSPQTIQMSGLDSATRYYAVAYAIDDNGVTGESQPVSFRTLEAAVSVVGHIEYGPTYDVLKYDVDYNDAEAYTFVTKGVEFSRQMDFHSDVQTFVYPSGATGWQNASPFEPNTLYYYRFFAEFEEIGRVYGQPDQNTITTMYAMPSFDINVHNIDATTSKITISYIGDYPIDYESLTGTVVGAGSDIYYLNLDMLTPSHPETVTISGLVPETMYEVEVWMEYYDTYAEAYTSFITSESHIHNFDFAVNTLMNQDYRIIDFFVAATQTASGRLTVTNIGIDICAVPDFSGHQLGGELGSYGLAFHWEANALNEHRRYYYRPWIETLEYGREYGETQIVESHWDIPDVTITEVGHTWNSITIDVVYTGGYPVPSNGEISVIDENDDVVETITANDLVQNGVKRYRINNLALNSEYTIVYEGAYYTFGNQISATLDAATSEERVIVNNTQSWAQNGNHTDVFVIDLYDGDEITDISFSYDQGITVISETSTDNTYTVITNGYVYNTNYRVEAEVEVNNEYTKTVTFSITVPTQNLEPREWYAVRGDETALPDTIKAILEGDYYDLNTQQSVVETRDVLHSSNVHTFHPSSTEQGEYGTDAMFYFDCMPQAAYSVKFTLVNVFGQSYTKTFGNRLELPYLVITDVHEDNDGIHATIGYNRYYDSSVPKQINMYHVEHHPQQDLYSTIRTFQVTPTQSAATATTAAKTVWSGIVQATFVNGSDYVIRSWADVNDYNSRVDFNYTTSGVEPLNFMPTGYGGVLTLTKNGTPTDVTLEWCTGSGVWTEWTETNGVRRLSIFSSVTYYIRNASTTSTGLNTGSLNYYNFNSDVPVIAGGSLVTMLRKTYASNPTISTNCFRRLFENFTNLYRMPNIDFRFGNGGSSALFDCFRGCTNLVETSRIELTVLRAYSCQNMFYGCSSLATVYVEFTDISPTNAINNWLYGVAATGTLYCPHDLVLPSGASGLPTGWTREDI